MGAVRFAGGAGTADAKIFCALAAGAIVFSGVALFVVLKPWPMERFTRHFIGLLGCLYCGLTLGSFAQHYAGNAAADNAIWRMVIATLSFQGATIALIFPFVRQHELRFPDAFGLSFNWRQATLFGVLVACIFLPVGTALRSVSIEIMSHFGGKAEVQQAVQVLEHSETWRDRLVIGLAALVFAPVGEEILFRGVLYPAVKQSGFPRLALWGTAMLFAAVHWNLPTFVPLLLLAVMLTLLYERTNNLLAPIVAHSLFNAMNFAMFLFQAQLTRLFQELGRLLHS